MIEMSVQARAEKELNKGTTNFDTPPGDDGVVAK